MKFDLTKNTEKVQFILTKKGIPTTQKMAVVLNLDVSGSARPFYNDGQIQQLFQGIVPLAISFDDNASLQVFTFAAGEDYVTEITPDATAQNYDGYINTNILYNGKVNKWGGTHYSEVIKANLENLGYYRSKKKGLFGFGSSQAELRSKNDSGFPSLIVTFTDGSNQDQRAIKELLQECENKKVNAYFLFIGVHPNVKEFKNIDDLGERFANVGFVGVTDIDKFLNSDDIYDQLLPQELVEWLKAG